jgi:EAL domain-containing protein (putative c-di-GMP-specific phosphodiesterase class I)
MAPSSRGAGPHGHQYLDSTLLDPRFPAEVAEALLGAGLPPDQLEIEIPEDLVVGDVPAVARTLAALRDIGVALSLDDFGGGHSGCCMWCSSRCSA